MTKHLDGDLSVGRFLLGAEVLDQEKGRFFLDSLPHIKGDSDDI